MGSGEVKAKPWPRDKRLHLIPLDVPNAGESQVTAIPESLVPQESLSDTDRTFQAIYRQLEVAENENNADAYTSALGSLLEAMFNEVRQQHGSSYGDLPHTMMEWARDLSYAVGNRGGDIKNGKTVAVRTNTVNNQYKPHGADRNFGRNSTDALNSQSFAQVVVDYVASRGSDYVHSRVVNGEVTPDSQIYSTRQVETNLKGYKAQSLAFLAPEPPPYSAPPQTY